MLQEFDVEIRDKKGTENLVADHLSWLETNDVTHTEPIEIPDEFLDEHLFKVTTSSDPWYADIVNYLAGNVLPTHLSN